MLGPQPHGAASSPAAAATSASRTAAPNAYQSASRAAAVGIDVQRLAALVAARAADELRALDAHLPARAAALELRRAEAAGRRDQRDLVVGLAGGRDDLAATRCSAVTVAGNAAAGAAETAGRSDLHAALVRPRPDPLHAPVTRGFGARLSVSFTHHAEERHDRPRE